MSKTYIPTINISSLIKNNFETHRAFKTIKEIEKACVDIGFFQVIGHGINLKVIKKTCGVGNKFLIYQTGKKGNCHRKNGIKKIKIYTEDIFPTMWMEKKVWI